MEYVRVITGGGFSVRHPPPDVLTDPERLERWRAEEARLTVVSAQELLEGHQRILGHNDLRDPRLAHFVEALAQAQARERAVRKGILPPLANAAREAQIRKFNALGDRNRKRERAQNDPAARRRRGARRRLMLFLVVGLYPLYVAAHAGVFGPDAQHVAESVRATISPVVRSIVQFVHDASVAHAK